MAKTIKDINDQYDYEDTYPRGKGDSPLVSCGQCDDYNELQYIYDTYLKKSVEKGVITKAKAINALEKACAEIPTPRKRQEFYDFLSEELDISI